MRNRRAIDLDELERQLRQVADSSDARHVTDPLAELARLVGQDDPFRELLSQNAAAAANRAQFQPDPAGFEAALHRSGEPTYAGAPHAGASHAGGMPQDDAFFDPAPPVAPRPARVAPPPRRSRKLLLLAGAACIVLVGGFGVFGMRAVETVKSGGSIPLIMASKEPAKERPANPGGVHVPNLNKDVYTPASERSEATTAKVVSAAEQPIDLSTAPMAPTQRGTPPDPSIAPLVAAVPGAPPAATPTEAPAAAQPPDNANAPAAEASAPALQPQAAMPPVASLATPPAADSEPKRVRSIAIRADDAAAASAPAAAPAPVMAAPAVDVPASATPAAVPLPPAAPARVAAAVATPEASPGTAISTPNRTAPATPARPAPRLPRVEPVAKGAPLSLTPPPATARTQAAARPQVAALAPASHGTAAAGGWSVQLGYRLSQADAAQAARAFAGRYAGQLGGAQPHVVQGQAGGKTVFRIRVAAGDRAGATALCGRVKTAGGSCFVAHN